MTLAAKWGDIVIGVDMHLVMVPTPAGPVPTPVPHPFIGVIFDPLGAAISAAISRATGGGGGLVLVNGKPTANTGTEVVGLGHTPMPPGTAFAPNDIPTSKGTLVTGSRTVTFCGFSQGRSGSAVMSCGYPVNMPTSVCIPLGGGPPVFIGGPEGVDAFAAITRGIRTKWMSSKLHVAANATKGSFRSKAICFLTGHPVDVMTGELISEAVDFELPGMIPIVWERNYRSRQTQEGALGPGWCHPFEESIEETERKLILRMADGRPKEHPRLKVEESDWDGEDRYTLTRTKRGYEKRGADGLRSTFDKVPGAGRFVLTRIEDRCGNVITLAYDGGRLREMLDTAGRKLVMRWTKEGRLAQVDVEGVVQVRYEYTEDGRLAAVLDPLDHAMRYKYRKGVMIKETRKNGLSFYFAWDWYHPEGWCVRTWGDGGLYSREITYDMHRHFTVVKDGRGGLTQYWGNELGLVEKMQDPMGVVTLYTWDEYARKTSETDGLGVKTEWVYDGRGNCVLQRDALGQETRVEYNEEDDPVRLIDAAGGVWEVGYDGRGKPCRVTDPLRAVTRYTFDDHGRLVEVEYPTGRRVRQTWTPRHDLASMTDGEGRTTTFKHDALGRPVKSVDAGGRVTRTRRDELGRIIELACADGERLRMTYDPEGNIVEQLDALDRRVRMRYEGLGRLVEYTDPMGYVVRLEHDAEEDLVAVVNQLGERYSLERDRAGRVQVEIGFDGQRRRHIYDGAGRLTKTLHQGYGITEVGRDVLGRLVRRKLTAFTAAVRTVEEMFAYDARGDLIEGKSGDAVVQLERDAAGRVVRERCTLRELSHEVESRYDADGYRVERTSSMGHSVEYQWDTAGDLRAMRVPGPEGHRQPAWEMTIARDALGLEVARRMPGGVVASWQRDALGRPAARRVRTGMLRPSSGMDVMQVGYLWSGPEQLAGLLDTQRGATRFTHDARGHLVAEELPDGTVQHRATDAAGNVYRSAEKSDRSYGQGGQVLRTDGVEYRYDGAGNLIEKRLPDGECWKFGWDPGGRLREVWRPDGRRVRFVYDALGRRVRKDVGGVVTDYLWDGNDLLHEVMRVDDEGDEAKVTWIFEPETLTPAAKFEGDQRFGIVTDHIGAPMVLMNEVGEVAWRAQLDVFGVPVDDEEVGAKTACPWRYPGQYEDQETGLFYNRFRYYDPELGSYISQDPIGLLGGIALYAYVDDPLVWIDPFGLNCGRRGERIARAYLEKRGFQVMGSIQNRSKHGIDLVARDAAGKLWFFEVKTTEGLVPRALRGEQLRGAAHYVPSRLRRATAANGPWKAVHDPNTATIAQSLRNEIRQAGGPSAINGEVIQITLGNGGIRSAPW